MDITVLMRLGYVGLFLVAFVSNAIPYSTVPYLVFIAPLLSKLRGTDLLIAILALASGATAGKLVVYFVGRSVSKIRAVHSFMSDLAGFTQRHKNAVLIAVFVVAALPIPDDILYIPVGATRYSVVLFTVALFAGKLVVTSLTALYGITVGYLLEGAMRLPPTVAVPVMVIVTVVLTIALSRVNWSEVEKIYLEKGTLPAVVYATKSFLEALILKPLAKLKVLFLQ